MKIKKIMKICVLSGTVLLSLNIGISEAGAVENAAELIEIGRPIKNEIVESIDIVSDIPNEIQEKVNAYIADNKDSEAYLESVLDNIEQSEIVDSKEIDQIVNDVFEGLDDASLRASYINSEPTVYGPTTLQNARESRVANPFTTALVAWNLGIGAVKAGGFNNTAMYMMHARKSSPSHANPSTHKSLNNAWAKDVINGELLNVLYPTVASWIRGNNPTLTLSGGHRFDKGDKYYALKHVSYSYTFVRQKNGGINWFGTVNDKYDFEWSKYNDIKADFANNYAVAATRVGAIQPYNIVIQAGN